MTDALAPEPAPSRGIGRPAVGRGGVIALALIGTSLALTLGFLLKRECLPGFYQANEQYTRNCYSDIIFLYGRTGEPWTEPGKEKPLSEHGLAYRDNNSEYPPLTGLFISSVNAPVREGDVAGFFRANAIGLSLFALLATAGLAAMARVPKRMLLFVAAPALISYAFHNWDLLPVGFTTLALWAFVRDKDALAGALLGLGAASKLYPVFIIPVLMLARRREGQPAAPLALNALLWFAIPNAIVLAYAGVESWWFPFKFQSERLPNFETVWYFLLRRGQEWSPCRPGASCFWSDGGFAKAAQALSLLIFVIGAMLMMFFEWRRAKFRPITTAFGVVILALITAKVFSPQYALWLLPFFVLVRVPWHAYAAFVVGDFLVLSAIWAYFVTHPGSDQDWHVVFLEVSVYVRYVLLGYVLWWVRRRGEDLVGEEPAPVALPAGERWAEEPPAVPAFVPSEPLQYEREPMPREPRKPLPVPVPPKPEPMFEPEFLEYEPESEPELSEFEPEEIEAEPLEFDPEPVEFESEPSQSESEDSLSEPEPLEYESEEIEPEPIGSEPEDSSSEPEPSRSEPEGIEPEPSEPKRPPAPEPPPAPA